MSVTAAMVKELRERTGSGMMECKKALVETGGDLEVAIENMRKSGMAKADKKAGRIAAEGVLKVATSGDGSATTIVEINSETDFVSKGDDFVEFATVVANTIVNNDVSDVEALNNATIDGESVTVDEKRRALIAKVGENINVRRFQTIKPESGVVGSYLHGIRIGVLVELEGGSVELAKDIAMHVAATNPLCISEAEVPAEAIEKEKEIFKGQAAESGKPPEIVEKMIVGKVKKFLKEVTLLGQPFVKDGDVTVEQLLKSNNAKVVSFVRFEVGEGIEKKEEDFASEVMAQVRGD
ncbi:translation elongation factor Ts [Cycloclasticus pugetii]|uniref:translation elongation factor Ts n=1 Tax=Cycloclasticus pugetii TaxID=34068 RepID=UPI000914D022|nr:translation elongation factor Ts [Cycloclasticus pugetii]SHJ34598.1 translation elongation factor Ts (EF-Ts) [Cycloclasticus pugetii]